MVNFDRINNKIDLYYIYLPWHFHGMAIDEKDSSRSQCVERRDEKITHSRCLTEAIHSVRHNSLR